MRIIILLCLFGIIFFACVCISFGYRLLSKLQDIQDDLAALEDLNNEQHSILEDKIISSGKKSEETAQAYDDLTQDVVKLMFGQGRDKKWILFVVLCLWRMQWSY